MGQPILLYMYFLIFVMQLAARQMYINPKNKLDTVPDANTQKIMDMLFEVGYESTLMPGDTIIRQGQLCDFFFIVISGCFRAYRYQNEKEIIIGFSFSGDVDTAPHAFIFNTHSTETIEALTKSTIIKVHRSSLDALVSTNPSMRDFVQNLLAQYIEILIQRIIEFKTLTAEQAYHLLLQRQPEEAAKIPLKYIASYLGISQERLSRIRKKIRI